MTRSGWNEFMDTTSPRYPSADRKEQSRIPDEAGKATACTVMLDPLPNALTHRSGQGKVLRP